MKRFFGSAAGSVAAVVSLLALSAQGATVRLKELADVQGVRENQLFGYGLVVGLAGTGDTEQVLFTSQALAAMLGRFGARVDKKDIRVRNVAAVMVTARLPPFARPGARIDVNVSSMGNARSLSGGTLLLTALNGPDGAVYAVAQGPVQAGGFNASAAGSAVSKNQPTSGNVPSGGIVEKAAPGEFGKGPIIFQLKQPDFTTASRVALAVNKELAGEAAKALDSAAIEVKISEAEQKDAVGFVARLEALQIDADQRARIVVSERTGTVVLGEQVRIRAVAVAHGGLQIAIREKPLISQPNAFSKTGTTIAKETADIEANESGQKAIALPATTSVQDLVKALNLLGAGPRDLIAILEAMRAAGALDADLEVL
jgi:flagellar P-ring protein precursor FlgI